MSWSSLGSLGSNLFSGGSGNFGDSSGGFDWGNVDLGSIFGGSSGSSTSSGGFWSNLGGWASKFLGGDGGNSSGNIYEGILSGLGGAADALISKETVEEQGKQSRKTLDFKYALEDFYNQKDKVRKRAALDTYGQFSTMNRWAPNATTAPAIDQPNKPGY